MKAILDAYDSLPRLVKVIIQLLLGAVRAYDCDGFGEHQRG